MIKMILAAAIGFLPASGVKNCLYRWLLGYKIERNVYIGISFILAEDVHICEGVRIGHLNVIKGIKSLYVGRNTLIGNLNRIVGVGASAPKFAADPSRNPSLQVGDESAITSRHMFDVQDKISIGSYTTIAGSESVFWTHEISILENLQRVGKVSVGNYVYIGARSTFLRGSSVGSCSVVAACSLVRGCFDSGHQLIAGVPAIVKKNNLDGRYFSRTRGPVD